MRARLVVFDLDGTLVDSRRDLARSANDLIVQAGGQPLAQERIVRMVGDGARRLVERAFEASGLGAPEDRHLEEFLAIYDRRLVETTRPYEGIGDLLAGIVEFATVALVTNKPTAPARRLLEIFDLMPFFSTVTGGDGPFPRKPSPESTRSAMECAGALPADTLLVGDSHVDVRTARAVGVQFCLAGYGFGVEQLPGGLLTPDDWVVERPLDLLDRLRFQSR
jgi:phosphoglycolate phosphatase